MTHKTLRIPIEFVHQIMNQIGKVQNGLEFVDLTKNLMETQKPYYSIINRCEELEKSFEKFEDVCQEKNIPFKNYHNYDLFNNDIEKDILARDKISGLDYFDLIETEVLEDERKMDEQVRLSEDSKISYLKILEEKYILEKLNTMFSQKELSVLDSADNESESDLRYIAGICNAVDEIKIERITFRISRGRAIPCFVNIDLDKIKKYTKNQIERKMFVILVQGNFLRERVLKILNIFNCHVYDIPNPEDVKYILDQTEAELNAKEQLILEAERTTTQFLIQRAGRKRVSND